MDDDIAGNWRKFKQRFNIYLTASGHSEKADKDKASLFLHLIGDEVMEVFNTFEFAANEGNEKLDKIVEKFENYCVDNKRIQHLNDTYFSVGNRRKMNLLING